MDKPRGTRAHDDHVVDAVAAAAPEHAEALAELVVGRVVEDRAVGARDDRQFALGPLGVEADDALLGLRVARGIEHLVGIAGAPQEVGEADDVRRVGGRR